MRVLCRHGHFAFYPRNNSDLSRVSNYLETEFVACQDFYTFEELKPLPRYSVLEKNFLTTPAIKTYEGRECWDVMRENNLVFSLATKTLVPKTSISILIEPVTSSYYFIPQTLLIQPGSLLPIGERIISYDGLISTDFWETQVRWSASV